ncbi:hypothetical protein QJS04_geneDACA021979 [Acorus gramineus]|uniref:Uncharacterized protein n=1 Tax=Acorus gramineus TaxID=55184 RepID=A0AAV9A9B5_ACOGR|nr:hypothetical protein QJS04_geneDACA021979 [Acorus gramineus]
MCNSRACKWESTLGSIMQKNMRIKHSGEPDPMMRGPSGASKPFIAKSISDDGKMRREEEKVENLVQLICWGSQMN